MGSNRYRVDQGIPRVSGCCLAALVSRYLKRVRVMHPNELFSFTPQTSSSISHVSLCPPFHWPRLPQLCIPITRTCRPSIRLQQTSVSQTRSATMTPASHSIMNTFCHRRRSLSIHRLTTATSRPGTISPPSAFSPSATGGICYTVEYARAATCNNVQ
jgi:hypothetical protein